MVPPPNTDRLKNWSDLTSKEFEAIYPVIELNAKRQFKCAAILAEACEHQNAIAHLILGTEELIKAVGSLMAARQMGIKQQSWFGKLFYHHKTRHDLIKDFFSIYLLFNASTSKPRERPGFWASVGNIVVNMAMAAANYLWWNHADDLKQRAFYVDYLGGIIDPADITVEDYETAANYVGAFERDITSLMHWIKNAPMKELERWEKDLDLLKIDQLRKDAYDVEKQIKAFKKGQSATRPPEVLE